MRLQGRSQRLRVAGDNEHQGHAPVSMPARRAGRDRQVVVDEEAGQRPGPGA